MEYIMNRLGFFKTHPKVFLPKFSTKQSACFDVAAQFAGKYQYKGYNTQNKEFTRQFHNNGTQICINPGDRIMVPTGYILDIPEGYSVRVHPRSGTSLKQGLILINGEGIIDSDYTDELYLLMFNASDNKYMINDGDRIAQGEMTKLEEYVVWESLSRPLRKSDRIGGMGSTGISQDSVITYGSTPTVIPATIPTAPVSTFSPKLEVLSESTNEEIKRGRGRPKGAPNKPKINVISS
jgi:dUTP pyrophosphatase